MNPVRSEFLRFLVAGGVAAAGNWSSRFLFSRFVPYEVAVVFAFFVGLTLGFTLMRTWVFESRDRAIVGQATTYLVVNLLALVQTALISTLLARWGLPALGVPQRFVEGSAHAVGIVVPVMTSFVGHKRATFKSSRAEDASADACSGHEFASGVDRDDLG